MLLLGLITSQFISIQDHAYHVNSHKQVSFLKAQLDHKQANESLFDGTNNSFELFSLLANKSNNDNLYYSQAIKAHNAEDFKKAIVKEVNNLYEAKVFDVIPLENKLKDQKLIKFI